MKVVSELVLSLNSYLCWNKARIECFARLLLGLIAVRTVNLQEIALAMQGHAQVSSRYRRLQRFFASFDMDFCAIARWLFKLFLNSREKHYVIIDRTNWYWGKQKINVFMLSVAYEGLSLPLFWQLLNKGGSSNYAEQKTLLNQFIATFGSQTIAGLLADREFGSSQLFKWLNRKKIPFYIRIKEESAVYVGKKKLWKANKLFNEVNPKTSKIFQMAVYVYGTKVFLSGSRSERGELMIVASNQNRKQGIEIYLRRWEIECLFQSLKGRGFRFEETHLTAPARIAKLIGLLAMGFAWAHKVGEWKALKKPIVVKKFCHNQRPQNSYFRYGLDHIREAIFTLSDKVQPLKECIKWLTLPLINNSNL